ncbi:hypothetical protein RchiOBHm_Chr5g0051821 [Rosa chinensis]|uniref:Uncharacterized protein n=1 Tax=Rosa chinensis TaxID=74649 RepID=A0A2P6QFI0_ROSCH|nr:hypothetical protein RchiOBHm_Chr5g0051821 [Rosa chinensis]
MSLKLSDEILMKITSKANGRSLPKVLCSPLLISLPLLSFLFLCSQNSLSYFKVQQSFMFNLGLRFII